MMKVALLAFIFMDSFKSPWNRAKTTNQTKICTRNTNSEVKIISVNNKEEDLLEEEEDQENNQNDQKLTKESKLAQTELKELEQSLSQQEQGQQASLAILPPSNIKGGLFCLAKQFITVSLLREQVRMNIPQFLNSDNSICQINEADVIIKSFIKNSANFSLENHNVNCIDSETQQSNFLDGVTHPYSLPLPCIDLKEVEYKSRRGSRVAKRAVKFFNKKKGNYNFSKKRMKSKISHKLKKLELRIIKGRKYYTRLDSVIEI